MNLDNAVTTQLRWKRRLRMRIGPSSLQLGDGHLDVWLCDYEELTEREVELCHATLSPEEKAKGLRFRLKADRTRHTIARSMTREVLARYLRIDPSSCVFETNEYGKPFALGALRTPMPVSFNVSHTSGLIALAIMRQCEVGVDVENVSIQPAPLDVADRYFCPSELAQLRSLSVDEQGLRFFEFWTLKEAYIKARGMGLSIPLDSFGFRIDGDTLRWRQFSAPAQGDPRWCFWQIRPTPHHVMAVCAESRGEPIRLAVRRYTPGADGSVLSVPVSRQSNSLR